MASSSFRLFDERIQRFIWSEGWDKLRDAQERAAPFILNGTQDVIIAAATAAGKTEAAFFPALTHFVRQGDVPLIVYISPLKALINDQFGRLQRLCDILEIPVWPWHGDINGSTKNRFRKSPQGVLLITPESLEAMLCNRGSAVSETFMKTSFFVIDEMHAFIGSERGKQLQSLMHRIDSAVRRRIPRVGLSATLGNMALAAEFLRPQLGAKVAMIISPSGGGDLLVSVKGYEEPLIVVRDANQRVDFSPDLPDDAVYETDDPSATTDDDDSASDDEPLAPSLIAAHLFKVLRGSNNLVFPNSRTEVERYTTLLNEECEKIKIPHEFWPHHGSLSKATREETESALKNRSKNASAICTNTLELGIDIGSVKNVCQIGAPYSVASLRQRLGRSGRRAGEPAILRGYVIEHERTESSSLIVELRLKTLQITAAILLLLEGWFEPPKSQGLHLSTLVQQLLSTIAQLNGATLQKLHQILCSSGAPFSAVSTTDLMSLVREMAARDLLIQDSSGILLHGPEGEKEFNHYSFYAAFAAEEEYKVFCKGKIIGSLPISTMLMKGQRILFAGKRWVIEGIDEDKKILEVKKSKGGAKPVFLGAAGRVHSHVRQKMKQLLESDVIPTFLDPSARHFLEEARRSYQFRGLSSNSLINQNSSWFLMTWMGDSANEALACLLNLHGWVAAVIGPGLEVHKGGREEGDLLNCLHIVSHSPLPSLDVLLADVRNLQREKWDHVLPEALLRKSYASLNLDLVEACEWARTLTRDMQSPSEGSHDEIIQEMLDSADRDFFMNHKIDRSMEKDR